MRHLSTLALAGLFGGLLLVGDASACHKKKAACACPAPAPVCAPAPVVCEAPVKKHHMKMPKIKLGCHKKAAACETYAPISYATPQTYATGQASGQGM
jgi:hypothetical protein